MKGGFSLSEFINAHYDKIYKYFFFKMNNQDLAEDLTQETFLKYFDQNTYVDHGKSLAYLYTIARNLCIDYFRKEKPTSLQEDISAEDKITKIETQTAIKNAVNTLSQEQQELILLRYANDLKINNISEITGLSRFTVRRKLKIAYDQLKQILREEDFA